MAVTQEQEQVPGAGLRRRAVVKLVHLEGLKATSVAQLTGLELKLAAGWTREVDEGHMPVRSCRSTVTQLLCGICRNGMA